MTEQDKQAIAALNTITYGLYVVASIRDGRVNAQCCNSLFQVTTAPRRIALGINKANLTHEFITASGVLCVNVLRQDQIPYVRHFGLQTGRKVEKFATVNYETRTTGSPVLPDALAFFDCQVLGPKSIDCGTHTVFICDVLEGAVLNPGEPLSYEFYRRNR